MKHTPMSAVPSPFGSNTWRVQPLDGSKPAVLVVFSARVKDRLNRADTDSQDRILLRVYNRSVRESAAVHRGQSELCKAYSDHLMEGIKAARRGESE